MVSFFCTFCPFRSYVWRCRIGLGLIWSFTLSEVLRQKVVGENSNSGEGRAVGPAA